MELPQWIGRTRSAEFVGRFYRQLAVLLNSGISLHEALGCLTQQERERQGEVVDSLRACVARGATLSHGMQAYPQFFPAVDVAMIRAAETSGALSQSLVQMADRSDRSTGLRKKVVSALTYPAIQFLSIMAVLLFFVLTISPNDDGIFSTLGGSLPWPTRVLTSLSTILRNPFWVALCLLPPIAMVVLFWRAWQSSEKVRMAVDDALLKLPVIGTLLTKFAALRVIETMEGMSQVGVPLLRGLAMAEGVVGNRAIRKRLELARRDIADGSGLGRAFHEQGLFGAMVPAMLEVGEEVGRLDEVFRLVSRRLTEEVEVALQTLVTMLEPLLMCVAGVAAGFVAVAGLMPFLQLISQI